MLRRGDPKHAFDVFLKIAKGRASKRDGSEERNVEIRVLKHRNKTVVTPTVSDIASGLFYRTLAAAGDQIEETGLDSFANICNPEVPVTVHAHDPTSIEWGEPVLGFPSYYQNVLIDGTLYSVRCSMRNGCPM